MSYEERSDETDAPASYRWTCPLCGESRVSVAGERTTLEQIETSLRMHIYQSDGGSHGPTGAYPDSIRPDQLHEFITVSDG